MRPAAAGTCDIPDADLLVKLATEAPAAYLTRRSAEIDAAVVQVKSATVAPLATAEFDVKVENDSAVARSFVLRASETGSDGWARSIRVPAATSRR